jgi:hypothetical protein
MRVIGSYSSRLLVLAVLSGAIALGGCAAGMASGGADAEASNAAPKRWNEDNLIQQNQLLPNGLRPLRYFYW